MNTTMNFEFTIPQRNDVSELNQQLFDKLQKNLGFVPNLYAYFAKSETALADYLTLQNRKSSIRAKEREIINLVVSEINGCRYCQSAHTAIGKLLGFTEDQIREIRSGVVSFDNRLNELAYVTKQITLNRGRVSEETKLRFFEAGFTEENLVDIVIIIADKIISNYIHNFTGFEIDFPLADKL